jgi:15-cis-phytoene synthase
VNLLGSFAYCRRCTTRSRSSFRFAFRLLPPDREAGMHALYAFLRETDDLSDDAAPRLTLPRWRAQLDDALRGCYTHRCHAALHDTVTRFGIPPEYLHEVITGVEGDLQPVKIKTFDELKTYCYRVASVVGLACVSIWGLKPGTDAATAERLAVEAGYAFQLTNILRDLAEDHRRGRVYLPAEELARFGVDPDSWNDPNQTTALQKLLEFQIERARAYYQSSAGLAELLSPEGAAIFRFMSVAYSQLLERIAEAGPDVLKRRVRLSRVQKLKLATGAWANRWRA